MITMLVLYCSTCRRTGNVVSRERRLGVDAKAQREGWVRLGPDRWRCPECEAKLRRESDEKLHEGA